MGPEGRSKSYDKGQAYRNTMQFSDAVKGIKLANLLNLIETDFSKADFFPENPMVKYAAGIFDDKGQDRAYKSNTIYMNTGDYGGSKTDYGSNSPLRVQNDMKDKLIARGIENISEFITKLAQGDKYIDPYRRIGYFPTTPKSEFPISWYQHALGHEYGHAISHDIGFAGDKSNRGLFRQQELLSDKELEKFRNMKEERRASLLGMALESNFFGGKFPYNIEQPNDTSGYWMAKKIANDYLPNNGSYKYFKK